jgi:hypothetical protein
MGDLLSSTYYTGTCHFDDRAWHGQKKREQEGDRGVVGRAMEDGKGVTVTMLIFAVTHL